MSAEPAFEPDRVVAALNAAEVAYVIVGGLAVGAHGVVRAFSLLRSGERVWSPRESGFSPETPRK